MSSWKPNNYGTTYSEYIQEKRLKRLEYFELLKDNAIKLKSEITPAEMRLGYHLSQGQILGITFYSQSIIAQYIMDFYAPEIKLAIEVDGSQHYQHYQLIKDAESDHVLSGLGITVRRYNNRQIFCELQSVLEDIYNIASKFQKFNKNNY